MTEHHDITLSHDILNPILDTGLQGLPEAISMLINHAMLIERSKHLELPLISGIPPWHLCVKVDFDNCAIETIALFEE